MLGVLRASILLPYSQQAKLGRGLGRLLYWVAGKRKRIARTNLKLCFPELTQSQREQLLKENFRHLGMALFETGLSWWGQPKRIRALGKITGMEHLQAALARGKGVILLTGHMTSLDLGGQILALALSETQHPLHVMYKRARNPVVELLMLRGRKRFTGAVFKRQDMRAFIQGLKQNSPVWYAPDQDFRLRQGVFAEFFGIPAATLSMTAKLAARTGAIVVPYYPIRRPNNAGIEVRIEPGWYDFPSGDEVRDAQRCNDNLEAVVRAHPEQYLWLHRRFKTRPEGEPARYDE